MGGETGETKSLLPSFPPGEHSLVIAGSDENNVAPYGHDHFLPWHKSCECMWGILGANARLALLGNVAQRR